MPSGGSPLAVFALICAMRIGPSENSPPRPFGSIRADIRRRNDRRTSLKQASDHNRRLRLAHTDRASSQALGLIPSIGRTTLRREKVTPMRNSPLGVVDDVGTGGKDHSKRIAPLRCCRRSGLGAALAALPSRRLGSSSIRGFGFEFCLWRSLGTHWRSYLLF